MTGVSQPGLDTAVGLSCAVGGVSGFYALDAGSNPTAQCDNQKCHQALQMITAAAFRAVGP